MSFEIFAKTVFPSSILLLEIKNRWKKNIVSVCVSVREYNDCLCLCLSVYLFVQNCKSIFLLLNCIAVAVARAGIFVL
jgi:hypothetical protein